MKRFLTHFPAKPQSLAILVIVLFIGISGCKPKEDPAKEAAKSSAPTINTFRWPEPPNPNDLVEAQIFKTSFSEDMILDLSPTLNVMKEKLQGRAVELDSSFQSTVTYTGLKSYDLSTEAVRTLATSALDTPNQTVAFLHWPIEDSSTEVAADKIWSNLLLNINFEDTQFGVLSGAVDKEANVFRMETVFEGRAKSTSGPRYGVKAHQTIEWTPVDGFWKISAWHQNDLKVTLAKEPLFINATESAIADEKLRSLLSSSSHENNLRKRFKNSTKLKNINSRFPHFNDWESAYQYPAVSTVDFDRDGWDDLYVMDRWRKSVLLRNNGDGTFSDATESSGLIVNEYANCALFADFDNDGDADAFIGRTLKPSLYFKNEDGKFTPDESINKVLADVKFVVAGSVADINRDGLLDLYLSTYCSTAGSVDEWISQVVRPDEIWKYKKVLKDNPFVSRGGPPNIVLMNQGGALTRPTINKTLEQWKNSYQSTWHDIDRDGDADLYICNDFSPDVVLRNDTEQGSMEPKFVDFSEEVFPGGMMGFGMGSNFGDYDSDGNLDLYVSNMYSKAGMRIVKQLDDEVDPRIKVSAQGNFLYRNEGGKFRQVAGLKEESQHVAKVGWSFGGQMADFNNDSKLDLYVPSGYFSAPKDMASTTDL